MSPMRFDKKISLQHNWNRHRRGDKPFKYKICDNIFNKLLSLIDKLVDKLLTNLAGNWFFFKINILF